MSGQSQAVYVAGKEKLPFIYFSRSNPKTKTLFDCHRCLQYFDSVAKLRQRKYHSPSCVQTIPSGPIEELVKREWPGFEYDENTNRGISIKRIPFIPLSVVTETGMELLPFVDGQCFCTGCLRAYQTRRRAKNHMNSCVLAPKGKNPQMLSKTGGLALVHVSRKVVRVVRLPPAGVDGASSREDEEKVVGSTPARTPSQGAVENRGLKRDMITAGIVTPANVNHKKATPPDHGGFNEARRLSFLSPPTAALLSGSVDQRPCVRQLIFGSLESEKSADRDRPLGAVRPTTGRLCMARVNATRGGFMVRACVAGVTNAQYVKYLTEFFGEDLVYDAEALKVVADRVVCGKRHELFGVSGLTRQWFTDFIREVGRLSPCVFIAKLRNDRVCVCMV